MVPMKALVFLFFLFLFKFGNQTWVCGVGRPATRSMAVVAAPGRPISPSTSDASEASISDASASELSVEVSWRRRSCEWWRKWWCNSWCWWCSVSGWCDVATPSSTEPCTCSVSRSSSDAMPSVMPDITKRLSASKWSSPYFLVSSHWQTLLFVQPIVSAKLLVTLDRAYLIGCSLQKNCAFHYILNWPISQMAVSKTGSIRVDCKTNRLIFRTD